MKMIKKWKTWQAVNRGFRLVGVSIEYIVGMYVGRLVVGGGWGNYYFEMYLHGEVRAVHGVLELKWAHHA